MEKTIKEIEEFFATYPGTKSNSGFYQMLFNIFPPHTAYFELFGGSGEIARRKKLSCRNIINDINPDIAQMLLTIMPEEYTITSMPAGALLDKYDRPDHLFYLDPPYIKSARRDPKDIYQFEMTDNDHEQLLKQITTMMAMVVISGYDNDLYQDYLSEWNSCSIEVMTHAGPATETIWYNYSRPIELHDYRYIGKDFTDRQRIKRKRFNILKRIASLPEVERNAFFII